MQLDLVVVILYGSIYNQYKNESHWLEMQLDLVVVILYGSIYNQYKIVKI
jgi:putative effector of murein hydrolase